MCVCVCVCVCVCDGFSYSIHSSLSVAGWLERKKKKTRVRLENSRNLLSTLLRWGTRFMMGHPVRIKLIHEGFFSLDCPNHYTTRGDQDRRILRWLKPTQKSAWTQCQSSLSSCFNSSRDLTNKIKPTKVIMINRGNVCLSSSQSDD